MRAMPDGQQGDAQMKAMWIAFAAIAVIAVIAWYGLGQTGFSAAERGSGPAVRLD